MSPAEIEEIENIRRGLERLLRYAEKVEDGVVIDWSLHLLNTLERLGFKHERSIPKDLGGVDR